MIQSRHASLGHQSRQTVRKLLRCITLLAVAALAACQSSGTEVLDDVATGPAMADERIGEGAVAIAMMLPRSASGEPGRRARDIRDGAALALADLGDGRLSITIHDTGGRAAEIPVIVGRARAAGARLLLGPATERTAAALVAVDAGQRPPAIAFVGNGESHGANVFALATDAVDSALESVRAAVSAGQAEIIAIVPQGFPAGELARLQRGVTAARGRFLAPVSYSGADLVGQMTAQREAIDKADAVILMGTGDTPALLAGALRSTSALQPRAVLIGNSAWPQSLYARPELEGALVAMPDQTGLGLIADRYRAASGRAVTIDAALGYDAVAVAAGLVRSMGDGALTPANLTRSSGFRGTTGIFRFEADGSVNRPLALYRLRGGALHLIDPTPAGF